MPEKSHEKLPDVSGEKNIVKTPHATAEEPTKTPVELLLVRCWDHFDQFLLPDIGMARAINFHRPILYADGRITGSMCIENPVEEDKKFKLELNVDFDGFIVESYTIIIKAGNDEFTIDHKIEDPGVLAWLKKNESRTGEQLYIFADDFSVKKIN